MAERNDKTMKKPKIPDSEKMPFFLFAKKQGGVPLTKGQIKDIKLRRKLLRQEMKEMGIKDRKEFEVMASGMNLYFDKSGKFATMRLLFSGKGGLLLLCLAIMVVVVLFALSWITTLRGHFTINMSEGMFREGFTLSETADFANPTTYLVCTPLEHVPCKSINDIPADVNQYDGMHGTTYFAYTYYVRNEGQAPADYKWELVLNSESKDMAAAVWVMVFEDEKMLFYAKKGEDGKPECIPPEETHDQGYLHAPLRELAKDPKGQYEIAGHKGPITYWRVVPREFLSEDVVTQGIREGMQPTEIHKYTVVMWLEGDDPECDEDVIGGHLGLEVHMELLGESTTDSENKGVVESWLEFWRNFWNKTPKD